MPSTPQITIGLVNNMPDAALEPTERQFLSLLDAASGSMNIRLLLFTLPNIPHNGTAATRVESCYSTIEDLWDANLDGLIVTGREPLTPNLADEPYWDAFTKVLEWAQENTYSTVWSCLAAHAAVLHSDGIQRVKRLSKYSGIFDCAQAEEHALIAGMPSRFKLPHSRWNGIPEDALASHGYSVLTHSADGGADTFVKKHNSLFVFFQGHPEYEADTLLLEYRRDVGRYLRGESETYPLLPNGYFDQETAITLGALEKEAKLRPRPELFPEVTRVLSEIKIENSWGSEATRIYRNWVDYISAQKQRELDSKTILAVDEICSEPALAIGAAAGPRNAGIFARGHKRTIAHSETPQNIAVAR
jgi:homoserine O-succinyltransferase